MKSPQPRPGAIARLVSRPARLEDMPACTQIWSDGIEDYVRRLNQPWFSGDLEPLRRLLAHFLATDPSRFWVTTERAAPDEGRVLAFGSATLRGTTWFLGMLFVLPEIQAAGVGRGLLERLLPPVADRGPTGITLGTATDSVQPISNALYSLYGMVPQLPIFNFVGRPDRPDALPRPPSGIEITETEWPGSQAETAGIAAVDEATLGCAHPEDHGFLQAEGRRRFVARSQRDGIVGYGYIAPSGRFGPLAATDPALLAPIAGHLVTNVRAAGTYATWIPGATSDLFVTLLRAGFRFESFPALLLWDRPLADFSRYVPINLALL